MAAELGASIDTYGVSHAVHERDDGHEESHKPDDA